MKHLFLLLLAAASVGLGFSRAAQASEDDFFSSMTVGSSAEDRRFTDFVRISVLGGGGTGTGDASATTPNAGSSDGFKAFTGAVLVDFGQGSFSFETGAQFLNLPNVVGVPNATIGGANNLVAIDSQYAALPLYLKYNYIERPDASFSFKLGALPALLMSNSNVTYTDNTQGGAQTNLTLPGSDLLVAAGFSGTTPLSSAVSFIIDGTYFYGLTDLDGNGTYNQGFLLSIGLSFGI